MFSEKKQVSVFAHPSGGSPKSQCNFSAGTLGFPAQFFFNKKAPDFSEAL
jgi:hypothetical protein